MYGCFRGFQMLFQLLPLSVGRFFGCCLGRLCFLVVKQERLRALDHLESVFPDWSPRKRTKIARRVFIHLGMNFFEWLKLPGLSLQGVSQLAEVEGLEHVQQVLAEGRGVIFVSGHIGNWEIMPLYFRTLGFEGSILARRLRYSEYESFLIRMREQKGIRTILRGGSLREMAKVLRSNQIMGIMPDQDIDSVEGIFVDFFGKPAYTPVGPALLSLMTRAPIVPVFNVRNGKRFKIICGAPLPFPKTDDRDQAVRELTEAWSASIEQAVRKYPDHWVWMHRRWKTTPSDGK